VGITIKKDDTKLQLRLKRQQQALEKLPREAVKKFVSLTPKHTGNARNRTNLINNKTIVANYEYASRLDEGYSKQAPQGMIKPFRQWLKEQLKKITGR
jgi:hypothetical protein